MAGLAIGGKSHGNVSRFDSRLEIILMTSYTLIVSAGIGIDMAASAVNHLMRAPQFKCRSMLIYGMLPAAGHRKMTILAICVEARLGVVRIHAAVEVGLMAAAAVKRSACVFFPALTHVAGVAVGYRVGTHQRKAPGGVQLQDILMIGPVGRDMTSGAIDSELIPVNVGMAVDTSGADAREFQIHMAIGAGGQSVGSGKRKTGFVMIEFQRLPHLAPRFRGMAIETIPLDLPVRAFKILTAGGVHKRKRRGRS